MKKIITEERLGRIFCFLSIALFMALFFFSITTTWTNPYDLEDEYVYIHQDSVWMNLLSLVGVLVAGNLVYWLGKRQNWKINMDIAAVVTCLCACLFSIYWIGATAASPQADQLILCECAEAFENGNFESLGKGQYVGIYRQQLGIITFLRLLLKVFGENYYIVFQYLNALMVPVLIFSGYRIVKRMAADNQFAQGLYLVLMAVCVPMYCYVPFVYGEITSTALAVFGAWMLLWNSERFSVAKLILLGIALGAAVQFRKNTLIFVIAFLIVLVIHLLRGWNYRILITMVSLILGVALFQGYITWTYHKLVPEDSLDTPASVFIAMGVNDDNGMPGWHNYYDQIAFAENDFDVEKTNQAAWEYMQDFFEKCQANPGYAADFYYRKIGSQWNVPMYQCLAMNNKIEDSESDLVWSVYYGDLRNVIEEGMDIYQLLIFGGTLCVLFFALKKWKKIDNYLLLITVFGGFLFSIIWEAKSRYVFPYFLILIPYGAAGIAEFIKWINCRCAEYFRKDGAL